MWMRIPADIKLCIRSLVCTRKGHPILKAPRQFQNLAPEGLNTTAFDSSWKQCGMQVPKGLKEELVEEAKECALGCTSKITVKVLQMRGMSDRAIVL